MCIYIYIRIYTPWKWTCLPKRDHFKREVSFEPWTDHHFVRYLSFQGGICYNQSFQPLEKNGRPPNKNRTPQISWPLKISWPQTGPNFSFKNPKESRLSDLSPTHFRKHLGPQMVPSQIQKFNPFRALAVIQGQTYNQTYNQPPQGSKVTPPSNPTYWPLGSRLGEASHYGWSTGSPALRALLTIGLPLFFLRPAIKPVFSEG